MKHSIHTRGTILRLWLATLACLFLGTLSVAAVVRLTRFTTPFSIYVFNLGMAVVLLLSAWKMLEQLTERIRITEEALEYFVWFRKAETIRWDEIEEVGVGQIYTPSGIRYRVFFAKSPLTDEEIDNLDLADPKSIYLNRLTPANYEIIRKHCPKAESQLVANWVR